MHGITQVPMVIVKLYAGSVSSFFKFQDTLDSIPADLSEILLSYSGIAKDNQLQHILKLRDEAYAIYPYPCLAVFLFLEFNLSTHPSYKEHVLSPLMEPCLNGTVEPLFLDIGTCFGQDLRKLVYDGALANRIWASDINSDFIELGFKLFNDVDKWPKDHFLCPGNLLSNSPGDRLMVLDDKVTILHTAHIFHLFNLEDQKAVVDRCLRLLRKDTGKPVLVIGIQGGKTVATSALRGDVPIFIHNEQSWEELWRDICQNHVWRDNVKALEVKSELRKLRGESEENMAWLVFEVCVTFS
ncbi:hypothetical protein F5Y11DRAFT_360944 [Daldinia sp. FL1419]|nr:hypothetical protein F5Y11DRAFT_360944 [Daldinia sp. FL1419]